MVASKLSELEACCGSVLLKNEENVAKHLITSCFHVSHSEPNFGCIGAFDRALASFHKNESFNSRTRGL
jgi:hypothetical protein